MGVLRVLRGLFTASTQVSESSDAMCAALARQILDLDARIQALEERLEGTQVELRRFRGRVYAWKGHELPAEAPQTSQELPLTDPKVTKEELRARLLKPGKPFKHN